MRNAAFYGLFLLLFLGAAALYVGGYDASTFFSGLFAPSYSFHETQDGILFVSNDGVPSSLLSEMSGVGSFILSPTFFDAGISSGSTLNSFMAQALIQQQIVLGGHHKVTTTLAIVKDSVNGRIVQTGCQTDYGTAKQSVFISNEECASLAETENSLTFRVDPPNPSLAQPLVIVSVTGVTIVPTAESEITGVNFLMLRAIFPDAGDWIAIANDVVNQTQG